MQGVLQSTECGVRLLWPEPGFTINLCNFGHVCYLRSLGLALVTVKHACET